LCDLTSNVKDTLLKAERIKNWLSNYGLKGVVIAAHDNSSHLLIGHLEHITIMILTNYASNKRSTIDYLPSYDKDEEHFTPLTYTYSRNNYQGLYSEWIYYHLTRVTKLNNEYKK
jgi:hypothetical protein